MKNILLLSLFLSSAIISVAQVSETHMALVNPKTATWCSPCGEWGIESTEIMVDENIDKAVFIELHNSDLLSNSFNDEILENFPLTLYTPAWYVNGFDRTYHTDLGQIPTYTENNVEAAVDSTYNAPPLANTNFTFSISGDLLTVNTNTKFFQDGNGEYYLAMYVVEDEVDEEQDGAPASYRHDFTLRSGMTETNTYGELINDAPVTSGTEFTDTYTLVLDAEWNQPKIWLAAVIWEKIGGAYSYINAYADYERIAVAIEDNPYASASVDLLQNPTSDISQLLIVSESVAEAQITLIDLNGRVIKDIYNGHLSDGENYIDVPVANISAGLYLIRSNIAGIGYINKIIIAN